MELCTCNCESMQEECVLYLRCGSDFSLSALPLSWSHLLCGPKALDEKPRKRRQAETLVSFLFRKGGTMVLTWF